MGNIQNLGKASYAFILLVDLDLISNLSLSFLQCIDLLHVDLKIVLEKILISVDGFLEREPLAILDQSKLSPVVRDSTEVEDQGLWQL